MYTDEIMRQKLDMQIKCKFHWYKFTQEITHPAES